MKILVSDDDVLKACETFSLEYGKHMTQGSVEFDWKVLQVVLRILLEQFKS